MRVGYQFPLFPILIMISWFALQMALPMPIIPPVLAVELSSSTAPSPENEAALAKGEVLTQLQEHGHIK